MTDSMNGTTIIAGGGIGGLAAAVAFSRASLGVRVLERSSELPSQGGGIQLQINGVGALAALGLLDAAEAVATPVDRIEFFSATRKPLVDLPLSSPTPGGRPTSLGITRPALIQVLRSAVPSGVLELGCPVSAVEDDAAGVVVYAGPDKIVRGDIGVGADGISSVVRRQFAPQSTPRYAGYWYVRALIDFEHAAFPRGRSWQFWGHGIRFGLYYVGYPRLNWYAVIPAPESGTPELRSKEALQRQFSGWPAPVGAVLDATPEEALTPLPIYDLAPLEPWTRGRVTLMGDAAHGATPGAGRGASEALEDGLILADCLTASPSIESALAGYEALRRAPTTTVIKRSRSIGALGTWSNPLACAARDAYIRRVYGRFMRKATQAEIARHAVTIA